MNRWVRDVLKRAQIGYADATRMMVELGFPKNPDERSLLQKIATENRKVTAYEALLISEITGAPLPGMIRLDSDEGTLIEKYRSLGDKDRHLLQALIASLLDDRPGVAPAPEEGRGPQPASKKEAS